MSECELLSMYGSVNVSVCLCVCECESVCVCGCIVSMGVCLGGVYVMCGSF